MLRETGSNIFRGHHHSGRGDFNGSFPIQSENSFKDRFCPRHRIVHHQRMTAVPQDNPAPKPHSNNRSPRWTLPWRTASSIASGMLAPDVLP